jgi:thiamine pyridinylase
MRSPQSMIQFIMRRGLHGAALGAIASAVIGCSGDASSAGDTSGGPSDQKTVLRVPLYPYIPDASGDAFKGLATRIEAEFEEAHPDVDLIINPSCFADDFYDPAAIARGLSGENKDCPYELIEIDTSFLGELVDTGALSPWEELPDGVAWHPAGIASATYDGKTYGVPHWLCSHFVFSRDASAQNAATASDLVKALDDLQTPAPNMAGDMQGSWNLPALYLDAWADTYGPDKVDTALSMTTYDSGVLAAMKAFSSTCDDAAGNPCVDGTYHKDENFDLPAQRFAQKQADAMFGYSERLHTITKLLGGAGAAEIKISSAPLGSGSSPLLFTDAFVLSKNCSGDCAAAATAFVEYMSAASTFEWIMAGEDAPEESRAPRYLMSASLDAYATPKLSADPHYQTIDDLTREGKSFPNSNLLGKKDQMEADILKELTSAP